MEVVSNYLGLDFFGDILWFIVIINIITCFSLCIYINIYEVNLGQNNYQKEMKDSSFIWEMQMYTNLVLLGK